MYLNHDSENGDDLMRRVVVDVQNTLFSDAIAVSLRSFDSDFEVTISEDPRETADMCAYYSANILIMEATSLNYSGYDERMKITSEVRRTLPNCKVVLIVDENAEQKLAEKVRLAKKDGLIDSFIYSSVSSSYLAAVIDSL
ncbi:MAG: hypothetical protein MR364_05960 [Oscillospiraceae bacterium]|nr:hypothetical protein [Oscillospiraceae bacterium]